MHHIKAVLREILIYWFKSTLWLTIGFVGISLAVIGMVKIFMPEYAQMYNLTELIQKFLKLSVWGGFGIGLFFGMFNYWIKLQIEKIEKRNDQS